MGNAATRVAPSSVLHLEAQVAAACRIVVTVLQDASHRFVDLSCSSTAALSERMTNLVTTKAPSRKNTFHVLVQRFSPILHFRFVIPHRFG